MTWLLELVKYYQFLPENLVPKCHGKTITNITYLSVWRLDGLWCDEGACDHLLGYQICHWEQPLSGSPWSLDTKVKKKYDACKKDTICSTKTPEDTAFIIIRTSALIEYWRESKLGIFSGKQTFLKGTCAKFPQSLSWLARFIVLIISDYVKLLNTLRKTKLKKNNKWKLLVSRTGKGSTVSYLKGCKEIMVTSVRNTTIIYLATWRPDSLCSGSGPHHHLPAHQPCLPINNQC